MTLSKDSPIAIVGAGVFGLSTAFHLTRRGYSNVTIFDKQEYHRTRYSYDLGCEGASSDINKFIRAAYGSQIEYQNLALEAITHWKKWNNEIQTGKDLPPGFTPRDVVYFNTGNLAMTDRDELSAFEEDTMRNMASAGQRDSQIVLNDAHEVERARSAGFECAVNPFDRQHNFGTLDIGAGFVYADKACRFLLHKIERLGVKTVFGRSAGAFINLIEAADKVVGIRTADGKSHAAELTVIACGGWTPSLILELDGLCETTAGSVKHFKIPRSSNLWNRLAPERFPVWTYNIHDGKDGGFYGFPRDDNGYVKIGYRGVKYTNPQLQSDGCVRSVPITSWSSKGPLNLPSGASDRLSKVVEKFLPELLPYQVNTRLCWYTDTFDNHFVIDYVPGRAGLMVMTGGSGHGFKFLPILGRYVVDRIEGNKSHELSLWKWRSLAADSKPHNEIMKGLDNSLALANQKLVEDDYCHAVHTHL